VKRRDFTREISLNHMISIYFEIIVQKPLAAIPPAWTRCNDAFENIAPEPLKAPVVRAGGWGTGRADGLPPELPVICPGLTQAMSRGRRHSRTLDTFRAPS
jgi:hypothetical protein